MHTGLCWLRPLCLYSPLSTDQTAFVGVDLNQIEKTEIHMQFTKCHTQHHIHKYFNKCCVFFPVFASSIRISSLSFASLSLFRFSIYVRLFGMLDIHILRSPQIYHNNPSILESEYRSTSTRRDGDRV